MDDRATSLATLVLAGVMLLACVALIAHQPQSQAAMQGTEAITYRINPNEADASTLCLLPRIGPDIAQRVIDDRQAHGDFQDADDLARVPMIGQKTVAALRPWLRLIEQD